MSADYRTPEWHAARDEYVSDLAESESCTAGFMRRLRAAARMFEIEAKAERRRKAAA